jgi:hypothetical protein
MSNQLLDPTSESTPSTRPVAARLPQIAGRRIGLLDISKARGDVFLGRLKRRLEEHGAQVLEFRKPTFAKVAPTDLKQEIAERCEALIEALAD